jgi:hypothetical protein
MKSKYYAIKFTFIATDQLRIDLSKVCFTYPSVLLIKLFLIVKNVNHYNLHANCNVDNCGTQKWVLNGPHNSYFSVRSSEWKQNANTKTN